MAFSIALFLYNAYLSLFEDGILDCEVLSADMESNIREICIRFCWLFSSENVGVFHDFY